MQVELKEIIDQLTELANLDEGTKVSALVDNDHRVVGWTVVRVESDGTINPIDGWYDTIKKLIDKRTKNN